MSMIDDYDEIERTVLLYVDGATKNDIDLVQQAFHKDARLFGAMLDGTRYDLDMPNFFADMAKEPLNSKGTYRARVISMQEFGPSAVVVLAEDGCWGDVSFIDILSLSKVEGVWKIVNKTFTHTGGKGA
jgi:hypothetical protein